VELSAAPISAPNLPIRAICRTPASYFHRFLHWPKQSEIICFGLILDYTIGAGTIWAPITDDEFVAATPEISKATIREALADLEERGVIWSRKSKERGAEYCISETLRAEVELGGTKIRGRCPDCKTVGMFYTRYVAVPHAFFRKLGACLDHAAYVCLAVVMKDSLQWTGKDGMWTEWVELNFDDFEQLTSLDSSSIQKALARLSDPIWGLIEKREQPGKANLYRAIPERFSKIERRGPRLVEQPKEKIKRTPPVDENTEKPNKTVNTHGIESIHTNFGMCPRCRHFVEPEELTEEEILVEQAERPQKKPLDRTRGTPEPQVWSPQPSYKRPDWKKEA